ncbi:ribose-phosphate diphosphokinase [Hydrogenophaga atypica]|uniref:Ribose-phosphate diphosphokinase n=1 Tax=Hydrogenophaga atypica TaxID=249409 RepID=A0ABW2QH49_9BURK
MSAPLCLLCLEDEAEIASRAAHAAHLPLQVVQRHRFPDGELRLQLPPELPARVVVWRGLHQPNEKLVELLLIARGARALGAQWLGLVTPYLAYMRQDIAFHPGEVVSQRVVGGFLADLFDAVLTVDPHLHRVATLHEAVPLRDAKRAVVLSGAPLLAELIAQHHSAPLLLGPDEESLQWVASAAQARGWDHAACVKQRHGDRHVTIALPALPALPVAGRAVVLLDDVASSGQTLVEATRLLRAAGAASVDVAVTHALFAGDAIDRVKAAGARHVWSTDCIPHPSNAVSIVPAVAGVLAQWASA